MDYYTAIKRNRLLLHLPVRVKLRIMVLAKGTAKHKGYILCDSSHRKPEDRQSEDVVREFRTGAVPVRTGGSEKGS